MTAPAPREEQAPGRRERRKRATRQALLDAGLELIGDRGVYLMRIEDVTERADVAKGAFYNYFDSKASLVAALVRDSVDALDLDYLRVATPGPELAQRLSAVAVAHEGFFGAWPSRELLLHQARGLLEQGKESGSAQLSEAFNAYLLVLGRFLFPARRSIGRAELDAAAAVAGTISGYRSFSRAAGQTPRAGALARLLHGGAAALSAKR
ncbi:MAG: TetR/AcrR family transcriptional regulator [Myxococcus sp.]|nr:TetR/AcrR family transcriptional regulator [Myxococcus sp.]